MVGCFIFLTKWGLPGDQQFCGQLFSAPKKQQSCGLLLFLLFVVSSGGLIVALIIGGGHIHFHHGTAGIECADKFVVTNIDSHDLYFALGLTAEKY